MGNVLRRLSEIGKRNSASDQKTIQSSHDLMVSLGASCSPMAESNRDDDPVFHFDEALDMSHNDLANLLRMALKAEYPTKNTYVWTRDVYDDYVVYEIDADNQATALYQRSYSILDGVVTFGDPVKVVAVTNYVPVSEADAGDLAESEEITGELVPLTEAKALGKEGIARIKVISPGFGSSGFYPEKTLEAAAAKFANAQCFWDHPTATADREQPERSLRDLAGKIVGTPTWEAKGATGPGIYADVQVFKPYQEAVEELAPHIGMSIRAMGKAGTAEVDGKKVRSIESIDDVRSVDFVTVPGRGGEILQLFESARGRHTQPPERTEDVDKAEFEATKTALAEAQKQITAQADELARIREAGILRDARAIVVEALAKTNLPTLTKSRLTESLVNGATAKDGVLEREALTTAIEAAIKDATAEIVEANGGNPVRGMGSGGATPPETPKLEESQKRIDAAIAAL